MVYAADAETLVVQIKPVLETYIRETPSIVYFTINGENISIYDYTHYVEDKCFVRAEVLWVGEALWIGTEPINKNWDVFLLNSFIEKTQLIKLLSFIILRQMDSILIMSGIIEFWFIMRIM